jgi:pyruvate dehydrogenase E2 component (dihydrolipoamide acetyltransferase)
MADFRMPSLGADMDVGTIVEWRVQPGEHVRRGDIVAVVETEKATIDVEVFVEGVVEELLVEPGVEVAVGTPLARIHTDAAEPTASPAPSSAPTEAPARPPRSADAADDRRRTNSPTVRHLADRSQVDLTTQTGTGRGSSMRRADVEHPSPPGRVRATPVARRLAEQRHVDLRAIEGSGERGAIVAADLDRAVPRSPTPPPGGVDEDRQARLRSSLAALMARSKREIPHYYLSTTIDMSAALAALERWNRERTVSERILPVALLLRAVIDGCAAVPELNGHFIDGAFHPSDEVHLGVAVNLRGGGLVAPALRDAGGLPAGVLMTRLHDMVGRARGGTLRSSEMSDPTITVTNLGEQGVESVFGVIYPPQVALVGFGRIVERPWTERGMVAVRPVVTATLAADHRVTDGLDGACFLAAVERSLEQPEAP